MLAHRATRNPCKERLAVLRGLCVAGHLTAARCLVDPPRCGGGCGGGDSGSSSSSAAEFPGETGGGTSAESSSSFLPLGDPVDVGDVDVEALLSCVCQAGKLDVAQWIVKRFSVKGWELSDPFLLALVGGHLEVVEWLHGLFDVKRVCYMQDSFGVHCYAFRSGNLEVMKWSVSLITLEKREASRAVARFLESKKPAEERIKGCKWVVKHYPSLNWERLLSSASDVETHKWFIQNGVLRAGETELFRALSDLCDVKFAEWLLDECHVNLPDPFLFRSVFRNRKDSVEVVKLLLQRAKDLPRSVIENGISDALASNNTKVVQWLKATYCRPPGGPVQYPTLADCALSKAAWFDTLKQTVDHVPNEMINVSDVVAGVEICLKNSNYSGALYLLNTFHPRRDENSAMWNSLLLAVTKADFSSAKQMAELGQFSQSDVVSIVSDANSTKLVKWLIESYHISAHQLTVHQNNMLLQNLVRQSRTGCTEWLIRKFHIQWNEVLLELEHIGENEKLRVSLLMWRMLLRLFPEITATLVREKLCLMWAAVGSPRHINHSIQALGLAKEDLAAFYLSESPWVHHMSSTTSTYLSGCLIKIVHDLKSQKTVNLMAQKRSMTVIKLPKSPSTLAWSPTVVSVFPESEFVVRSFSFSCLNKDHILLQLSDSMTAPRGCQLILVDMEQTNASKQLAVLSSTTVQFNEDLDGVDGLYEIVNCYYFILVADNGTRSFVTTSEDGALFTIEEGTGKLRLWHYLSGRPAEISQLNKSQFCLISRIVNLRYDVWDINDTMLPVRTTVIPTAGCTSVFVEGGLLFQVLAAKKELHVNEESTGNPVLLLKLSRDLSNSVTQVL
ncbi:hypothetical protein Pelo_14433 [Pelomyxa schiedti]|nr:hypothetical protein Pelo_14433 [Pelomyxa schiedti]